MSICHKKLSEGEEGEKEGRKEEKKEGIKEVRKKGWGYEERKDGGVAFR